MNNPQFLYSHPIFSQHHPIYPPVSSYPYFIMMSPYISCQPFPILQSEIQVSKPPTIQERLPNNESSVNQPQSDPSKPKSSDENLPYQQKDPKIQKIQRLRDPKGRYFGIRKMAIKQRYKQNPKRNVITNIGNQLLAYASNRSKSAVIIKQSAPHWVDDDVDRFYEFMLNLRKSTDYYLNITKMRQIWYPAGATAEQVQSKNMGMLRAISYYYFTNMIHLFVLNSAKIKKSSKIFHIRAIRALLRELAPRKQL